MTDVIEGMARAIYTSIGTAPDEDGYQRHRVHLLVAAQAALDYLKQPAPASKPLLEGQGPELTIEQIRAMEKLP
jgi:hypothetical protein